MTHTPKESIADHFAAQLAANDIELKRPTNWQKEEAATQRRKRHADAESLKHEPKSSPKSSDGLF